MNQNTEQGVGGSYVITAEGERVIVHRTDEHGAAPPPDPTPPAAEPVAQAEPEAADAAFFTPVAPADFHTTE